MTVRLINSLVFLCALVLATSCKDQQVEATSEVYLNLPAIRYQYGIFNDTSNAVSTLGRVLFYDRNLSANNTIACASCHKQSYGFADNKALSRGFGGKMTTRNSLPIQNIGNFFFLADVFIAPGEFGTTSHLFWDGRESSLERLVLQPIGNHIEMGVADAATLTKKLSDQPYYASLFSDAFGSSEITSDRISTAISAFARAINTNNTRFDQFNQFQLGIEAAPLAFNNAGSSTVVLNSLEIEGMILFKNKYDCNSCHHVESTSGYAILGGTFANIGLDKTYADPGLQDVTGLESDAGKFKIPSLRNLAYTAPYMHDGRFKTLADVLEHYSSGISEHPNLDDKLKDATGHARNMNISQHERDALIAFLNTLSDQSVLTDPKFSNPFEQK